MNYTLKFLKSNENNNNNNNLINEIWTLECANFPDNEAATKDQIISRINLAGDYFLVMLDNNNKLIGFINSSRGYEFTHESMSTHEKNGNYLFIHSNCINIDYINRNYGVKMMHEYINKISNNKNNNVKKMALLAKIELVHFYEKFGFKIIKPSEIEHGAEQWFEMELNLEELHDNKIKYCVCDAFTNELYKGNPASIIYSSNKLNDNIKLNIAKEFNLSETAYIEEDMNNNNSNNNGSKRVIFNGLFDYYDLSNFEKVRNLIYSTMITKDELIRFAKDSFELKNKKNIKNDDEYIFILYSLLGFIHINNNQNLKNYEKIKINYHKKFIINNNYINKLLNNEYQLKKCSILLIMDCLKNIKLYNSTHIIIMKTLLSTELINETINESIIASNNNITIKKKSDYLQYLLTKSTLKIDNHKLIEFDEIKFINKNLLIHIIRKNKKSILSFKFILQSIESCFKFNINNGFKNGIIYNELNTNIGSLKVLLFAKLFKLNKLTTLKLWSEHYFNVLNDPNGTSHGNIRNFIKYGWLGIDFLTNSIENKNEKKKLMENLLFKNPKYLIRWFTPTTEVDLCGHATLNAFKALTTSNIFNNQPLSKINNNLIEIEFQTKNSGKLTAKNKLINNNIVIELNFPIDIIKPISNNKNLFQYVKESLNIKHDNTIIYIGSGKSDLLIHINDLNLLKNMKPNYDKIMKHLSNYRGLIVTVSSNDNINKNNKKIKINNDENFDFYSRFFAPVCGINEDPVTGSAHCSLGDYYSKYFNKNILKAKQLSERGGILNLEIIKDRVLISGESKITCNGYINL